MQIRPHRIINRRKTRKIKVEKVFIGGDSPISVQSMTNTITSDETSTINQINQLKEVGADLVRISCPDQDSTKALKNIIKEVKKCNKGDNDLIQFSPLPHSSVNTLIKNANKGGLEK